MKKFYQCDVAESGTESIWTSSVIYAEAIEEAEFRVMLELQADWGDGYMPDAFLDAFGGEPVDGEVKARDNDPEFPGVEAWETAGYWGDAFGRNVTAGMLEVEPLTALAKLGKITFDVPDDVVDAVMCDEARLHVVVDMRPIEHTDCNEATDADRIEAILEIDRTEGDNMGSETVNYMVRAAQAQTKSDLARIVKEALPLSDQDDDEDDPPKFAPGVRVYIHKVDKTKTVVSSERQYGHERRYVLKGDDNTLDEGWREDELELVESDEELLDKADQKHNATMLDGCETEDEINAELRAQTQGGA